MVKILEKINNNHIVELILSFCSSMIFFIGLDDSTNIINNIGAGIPISILFVCIYYLSFQIKKYKKSILRKNLFFCNIFSIIMSVLWLFSATLIVDNTFNNIFKSNINILKSVIYVIGSYYFIYLISLLTILLLEGKVHIQLSNNIDAYVEFFKYHLNYLIFIIIACWLPYIIVSYPAIIDWDGWHSITVYLGFWGWTNFLHIFHTLFIGCFVSLGQFLGNVSYGLYLATLLQVVVYLFVIKECFKLIFKLKTNNILKVVILLVFCFSPYYSNYSSALIKDGIYSIFLLLLFIQFIKFLEWPDEYISSKYNKFIFFLSAMGTLAFRKNGMHIYIPTSIIFLFYIKNSKVHKHFFNKVLLSLILPIILILASSQIVTYKTKALRGSINETLSLPYQQTARYLKYHPDDVSDEEKKIISKVLLYDQLAKVYDPMISDKVKSSVPDHPRNTKDMINYLIVWFKMFFKHPETYFAATFNQNYPLIYPFYGLKKTYFAYDPDYNPFLIYNEKYLENKFELKAPLKKGKEIMRNVADFVFNMPFFSIVCNISFFSLYALFVFIYVIVNKKIKLILTFLPIIFSMIIVILSPTISHMPRYAFPIYYLLPIAICYLLYLIRSENG